MLEECIRDRFDVSGDLHFHGIAASDPGLPTVTRDYTRDHQLLGLHLDNWDRLPLPERRRSLYRIAINIGRVPRHFLFLNVDVMEMCDLLLATIGPRPLTYGFLREAFFGVFPDYPVLRLTVEPGFAYIAPTDLIFHDGSTLCAEHTSFQFVVRGRFGFE